MLFGCGVALMVWDLAKRAGESADLRGEKRCSLTKTMVFMVLHTVAINNFSLLLR